jgi:hypothetical protein
VLHDENEAINMVKKSSRIGNLIAGAASLISLFPPKQQPRRKKLYRPAKSVHEALKQDWRRLGDDMSKAIERVAHGQR